MSDRNRITRPRLPMHPKELLSTHPHATEKFKKINTDPSITDTFIKILLTPENQTQNIPDSFQSTYTDQRQTHNLFYTGLINSNWATLQQQYMKHTHHSFQVPIQTWKWKTIQAIITYSYHVWTDRNDNNNDQHNQNVTTDPNSLKARIKTLYNQGPQTTYPTEETLMTHVSSWYLLWSFMQLLLNLI